MQVVIADKLIMILKGVQSSRAEGYLSAGASGFFFIPYFAYIVQYLNENMIMRNLNKKLFLRESYRSFAFPKHLSSTMTTFKT